MVGSLRIWSLYFRSKLRRVDPERRRAVEEEFARAKDLAEQIMDREWALFGEECVGYLAKKLLIDAELPFLWGVFCELVQEYPNHTINGFDRVQAHLLIRLMDAHGYSFEAARDKASNVNDRYNQAEELFDELASLGQKTFHDGRPGRLQAFVTTLNELEWSSNPGAHEAHLIRRHNNPYFSETRRMVSKDELAEAPSNGSQ